MNEAVKFEVPQIQLSGKYKIQLFDKDTNELIEEVEKHNVISKIPFSTAFYNHIYRGFIYNDNRIGLDYSSLSDTYKWYSGYINWLMLTNDPEASENDDKNPVIFGDMIGYARYNDNNSYSDVKRGIFNQNETTYIENKFDGGTKIKSVTRHIVWDFPTDKGNGTFDNIYLVPNPYDNYNPDDYRGQRVSITSLILSNEGNYNYKNDYNYQGDIGTLSSSDTHLYMQCLYYKDDGKTQHWDKIAKLSFAEWKKDYITLNVPEERKNKAAYIIYACGMFWRIESDYTISRYNLDGSYKDTISIKNKFANRDIQNLYSSNGAIGYYDTSYYTNYQYLYNNRYDFFTGDNEYLYVSYKLKKTNEKKETIYETYICSVNRNGDVISEVLALSTKDNKNYSSCAQLSLAYINGEKYLLSSTTGNRKVFKVNNGILKEKSSNILKSLSSLEKQIFYSKEGLVFILGNGYKENGSWEKSLYVYTLIPWSSHCKLSSPVTKTSTNTMKIQYDVTVDYIMPNMIENLK
ncbi:hypothetical protein [Clostridium perfringens]|uniref:hypothetical protein n=1 Tax=Clostridium perfringens TaxID=1502 RepID=UPI000F51EC3D|nr:hypothetical protein [Clostridium perfringens]EJT6340644.1 hypothetical protein [Clostridium perfringens]CAJ1611104.1 hypothetical protein CLO5623_02587 [Clostridium perfringens]DAO46972.1 MAG TPA: hypothetical protein [Bacteriophage sp.]